MSSKIECQEFDLNDVSEEDYIITKSFCTIKINNITLEVPSIKYCKKNYETLFELVPIPFKNKYFPIFKS